MQLQGQDNTFDRAHQMKMQSYAFCGLIIGCQSLLNPFSFLLLGVVEYLLDDQIRRFRLLQASVDRHNPH